MESGFTAIRQCWCGIGCLMLALACAAACDAAELRGLLDLSDAVRGSTQAPLHDGLDKLPDASNRPAAHLTLRGDTELPADLVARIVADADSTRRRIGDVQEVWLGWHPIPKNSWRTRVRAGAFLPVSSLELDYDGVGWTPTRTVSSSAVNSWLGEELRVKGGEFSVLRRGVFANSPHSYGAVVAAFGGNDPAGTLLAWRGWNLAGRVTGLLQSVQLPDLPVYRPQGPIPLQTRDVQLFREIDGRTGYYAALTYGYAGFVDAAVLHYDNRADPLRVEHGQYGWHTRFDHLSLRAKGPGGWELLAQALRGETLMGPNAVHVNFSAAYLLASHALGAGLLTARLDYFDAADHDVLPQDANGEHGHALALAYRFPLSPAVSLFSEALGVRSTRPARQVFSEAPTQTDGSLTVLLRWAF